MDSNRELDALMNERKRITEDQTRINTDIQNIQQEREQTLRMLEEEKTRTIRDLDNNIARRKGTYDEQIKNKNSEREKTDARLRDIDQKINRHTA